MVEGKFHPSRMFLSSGLHCMSSWSQEELRTVSLINLVTLSHVVSGGDEVELKIL
jgi:hypothetical protein